MRLLDLEGIPYKDKGCNITGFDCYGFYIFGEKIGGHYVPRIEYNDTSEESFNKEEPSVENMLSSKIKEIPYPIAEYDTIVFYNNKNIAVHVGIYLNNGRFIHCDKHGVHVDCLTGYFRTNRRYFTWL
jgi:cell wall-associated NlpC family hydrolase